MASPPQYADLEITFSKRDAQTYAVHFRYDSPLEDSERTSETDPVIATDWSALNGRDEDPDYGKILSSIVFTDKVAAEFASFRTVAAAQSLVLRVRLVFDSSAPELHALHWETMRDPANPETGSPLFMGEGLVVSRFLNGAGSNWRPVRAQARTQLRALVVVSNAPARTQTRLAPIDIPATVAAAQRSLCDMDVSLLVSGADASAATRPSLQNITGKLRDGFDVLYLVCHGQLAVPDPIQYPNWTGSGTQQLEPHLYLDGADDAIPTLGHDLVQAIDNLEFRPRLIVMASCQSAGQGDSGLAGLGPRLAKVGVPAVIAMQGNVYMKTADIFMHSFFRELARDGRIDRAMNVARADTAVDRTDYWRPVLFLRLKTGCMWYEPGFTGGDGVFDQWLGICDDVQLGNIVPVLGPDIVEHILGSTKDLASNLARASNFTGNQSESLDLAKVAQMMLMKESVAFVQTQVRKGIRAALQRAGARLLPNPIASYPDLMAAIADNLSEPAATPATADPLKILADLNASVFINASGDTLLEKMIARSKVNGSLKVPTVLTTEWRNETQNAQAGGAFLGEPEAETPFIYYMFGQMNSNTNWVLTEDDYFDYLIQTAKYKLTPAVISNALISSRLLFLGFHIDDLKFRSMFRLIFNMGGRKMLEQYKHVGVQVDPGETTLANAQKAKEYLTRYFQGSKIDIYWGTSTDFLRQLRVQLDKAPAPVELGGL
jgi:hypothetical protein